MYCLRGLTYEAKGLPTPNSVREILTNNKINIVYYIALIYTNLKKITLFIILQYSR